MSGEQRLGSAEDIKRQVGAVAEAGPCPPALPARLGRTVHTQIPGLLIARRNRPVVQHRHPRLNMLARRKPGVVAVAGSRPVTAGFGSRTITARYGRVIARLARHLMDGLTASKLPSWRPWCRNAAGTRGAQAARRSRRSRRAVVRLQALAAGAAVC